MPEYLQNMLIVSPQQAIPFQGVSELKGGQKFGKDMSNLDKKWTEEWFELICKDTMNRTMLENKHKEKKSDGIVVKFYTKLWTNCDDNSIEGESCL